MSNSNLLPIQSVSGVFTCPCENTDSEIHCLSIILRCWFSLPKILVRTHGTPASRKARNCSITTSSFNFWSLLHAPTIPPVRFVYKLHYRRLPSLRSLFLPSNGTDRFTAKRTIDPYRGTRLRKGRYVVENVFNCNASPCKHMAHSLHVSPGVGLGIRLL